MEEKSTSEKLSEILPQLSKDQLRYIVAFQDYPSKKEACQAIGIKPNTVYKWNDIVDEAAKLMAIEAATSAMAIRRRSLIKAMLVKIAGLDSKDEGVRQKAATELIEWELGKAVNNVDIKSNGKELPAKGNDEERFTRAIETLADALRETLPRASGEQDGKVDTAK